MADANRVPVKAGSSTLLTVVVVVAVLYVARVVFIPMALAILLAFMLVPLVVRLRRLGLGRVISTLIAVLFAFLLFSILAATIVVQSGELAHRLPGYQQNVREKLDTIRSSGGGIVRRVSKFIQNISDEFTPPPPTPSRTQSAEERPVPVEIRRAPFAPMEVVQKVVGSILNVLIMGGVVIVFVIFMLIQREDLRDRLIRLAGEKRINVTTQLLDDAAYRVSRYLLAQLALNVLFGLLAGVGLYLMRVPNPALWGMVAVLLRYIPYLGIWVAAGLPAAVVFAVQPGWLPVLGVFALYFGIDLLMYNFGEPLLYGSSTGVSPIAILVAAVFWTWLWGPVGLLLATPLTVCVVVIGRHAPNLGFLSVLLSDDEVLGPESRFYQRMLAMDVEEATEVAESFLKGRSMEELYDRVVVPALSLAEQERHHGALDEQRKKFLMENTRMVVEHIAENADEIVKESKTTSVRAEPAAAGAKTTAPVLEQAPVLCVPGRDEADAIAALMLSQLLKRRGIDAIAVAAAGLASDHVQAVESLKAGVVCVVVIPPFGYMHARYLCRRFQTQFPGIKLVGTILTEREVQEVKQRQPALSADSIATSLQQAVTEVIALVACSTEQTAREAVSTA